MIFSNLGLKVDTIWLIGKHKNKEMKDLPIKYLTWVVLDSHIDKFHVLRAKAELERRGIDLLDEEVILEDDDSISVLENLEREGYDW